MSPTGLEDRDAAAAAVAVKPRVTLDQIKTLIASERYFIDDTLTICVLTLKNGYKVTGESAAADPANFNEELGRKIAKDKATAEIWPLAGFLLRDSLHKGENPAAMRCKVQLSGKSPNVVWSGMGRRLDDGYPDPSDAANHKQDGQTLRFNAVWESGSPDGKNAAIENRIFHDATPWIDFTAVVRNQAVLDRLTPGQTFYVDFIPAD